VTYLQDFFLKIRFLKKTQCNFSFLIFFKKPQLKVLTDNFSFLLC